MIVTDASAVLEVLLRTPAGETIGEDLLAPGETLHAPHLIDLEVTHVLRRLEVRGELAPRRALLALKTFAAIRLSRYPHEMLLPRIWELRKNLTAYDAAYIALAEVLDAPLFTCDRSLASVPGVRAEVRVFSLPDRGCP